MHAYQVIYSIILKERDRDCVAKRLFFVYAGIFQ